MRIRCSKGSIDNMLSEFQYKLDELTGDGIDSSFVYPDDLEDLENGEYESHMTEPVNCSIEDDGRYEEIDKKLVYDSDGFTTDYTMYFDHEEGRYVFVFGDSDIYRPEDEWFDYECEDIDEAYEWFESYNGFEDDIEGCDNIMSSKSYNVIKAASDELSNDDYLDLRSAVMDVLTEKLDEFEDNLFMYIDVPGYDSSYSRPDFDPNDKYQKAFMEARGEYLERLTDLAFEEYLED